MARKHSALRRYVAKKLPFLHFAKQFLKWRVDQPLRRAIVRRRVRRSEYPLDPFEVHPIELASLRRAVYRQIPGVPNTAAAAGVVLDGDWDLQAVPVEDLDVVKGARDRFERGLEWKATDYYRTSAEKIRRGEEWRGCRTPAELDAYFRRFDDLFERIRRDGYRTQAELRDREVGGTAAAENEIAVHVGRDGEILFGNGAHRLAIALVLGLDRVPAKVCIRHAKWVEFCKEIVAHAGRNGGHVYQPLTHPDLRRIPAAHGEERYEIIRGHLPSGGGTLLDIGACWGYFCERFEPLGFECTAVENDLENVYFMRRLRTAQGRRFAIVPQSILALDGGLRFDVVLALNVFHHFLKTEREHGEFIRFLGRLDARTMILEPHVPEEPQMVGAYRNYPPGEFVEFILAHSSLRRSELIGRANDGRPLYRLSRD